MLTGKQTPGSETMADSGHSSSASNGAISSTALKLSAGTCLFSVYANQTTYFWIK